HFKAAARSGAMGIRRRERRASRNREDRPEREGSEEMATRETASVGTTTTTAFHRRGSGATNRRGGSNAGAASAVGGDRVPGPIALSPSSAGQTLRRPPKVALRVARNTSRSILRKGDGRSPERDCRVLADPAVVQRGRGQAIGPSGLSSQAYCRCGVTVMPK